MIYAKQLKESYKLIISYIGTIVIGAGVIMLLPLLVLPFYPGESYIAKHFILSAMITCIVGVFMRNMPRIKDSNVTLSLTEGGVIVVVAWFLTIFLSSLPFLFSGMLGFHQAMFEVVSGWTTTGLSVVDVDSAPNIFLFWRSIMQFFGGAGLAVIMLSAIIGPHGMGLYIAEGRTDKLLPNMKKSTKLILTIYLGYFLVGTIGYIIAGMPVFDAINHAMAALSTGGFSTKANSIGSYNNFAIELVTIFLMLAGTTNFAAHFLLLRGKFKQFFQIDEVKLLIKLLAGGIVLVVFISLTDIYPDLLSSLRVGVFGIVSSLSTSGFATVDYNGWPTFAVFVMVIFMILGGGAGSTAGGIKLYRIDLMLKSLYWNIKSYLQPKSLVEEHYLYRAEGKHYVTKEHSLEVSSFIILFLITYLAGVGIFLAYGFPLKESMFEFASCVGTVGLSMGITSASAPVGIIWTQIVGMILGRLEFFVIFIAFIKIFRDMKFIVKSKVK